MVQPGAASRQLLADKAGDQTPARQQQSVAMVTPFPLLQQTKRASALLCSALIVH